VVYQDRHLQEFAYLISSLMTPDFFTTEPGAKQTGCMLPGSSQPLTLPIMSMEVTAAVLIVFFSLNGLFNIHRYINRL
jgi:hypothetical protein